MPAHRIRFFRTKASAHAYLRRLKRDGEMACKGRVRKVTRKDKERFYTHGGNYAVKAVCHLRESR